MTKEGEEVNKENKGFVLYKDWAPLVFRLTSEEKAAVFEALFRVAIGEPYEVPPSVLGIFEFFLSQIEKNDEKWEETRQKRREAGRKGGQAKPSNAKQSQAKPSTPKHNNNNNNNNNVNVPTIVGIKENTKEKAGKPPRVCFVPPTVEEVKAYCLERQNTVDPEAFVAFYNSNGWLVGKNKMKNWKSAVITWEKRQDKQTTSAQTDTGLTDWYKIAQEVEDEQRNNGTSYVDIFAGIPATVREDVGG